MKTAAWIVTLVVLLLASGCASGIGTKQAGFTSLKSDKVFVAPPTNLTHGGSPVEGSGEEFLGQLEMKLREFVPAVTMIRESRAGKFTYATTPGTEEVIDYARSLGADYAIICVLGEMRDAAPFTFRPDFVTLNWGAMYRVADRTEVWKSETVVIQGGNPPAYNRLLTILAERVVKGMVER